MNDAGTASRPLDGVKVLDLARVLCRYQHFVTIHFSSRLGHPLASPLQVVD
jgi:hypothetical protein